MINLISISKISFITKIIRFIINMSALAVFGRFISKESIGIFAITFIIFQLVQPFVEGGLTNALYKFKGKMLSESLHLFTIIFSIICALFFTTISFSVNYFTDFTIPFSLIFYFIAYIISNGFFLQKKAILMKKKRFVELYKFEIFSVAIASLCAIFAAINNLQYDALIIKLLVEVIILNIFISFVSKIKINLSANIKFLKKHLKALKYGISIAISRFISGFSLLIDKFLIASIFPIELLGVYHYLKNIISMPDQMLRTSITSPGFVFLAQQNDDERKNMMKIIGAMLTFYVIPLIIPFLFYNKEIIGTILGQSWIDNSFIIFWLSFYGIGLVIKGYLNTLFIDTKNVNRYNLLLFLEIFLLIFFIIYVYFTSTSFIFFVKIFSISYILYWSFIYIYFQIKEGNKRDIIINFQLIIMPLLLIFLYYISNKISTLFFIKINPINAFITCFLVTLVWAMMSQKIYKYYRINLINILIKNASK